MCAATLALRRLTSLILPVVSCQKDNVYTPDNYRAAWLNRLGGVHEIAPYDVPTGMIVVRLYRPGPRAALRLQGLIWRGIELAL